MPSITALLLAAFSSASISVSSHLGDRTLPGSSVFVAIWLVTVIPFSRMRAYDEWNVFHEADRLLGRLHLAPVGGECHLAAVEHGETIGDVEDVVDVVADKQDRAAARLHLPHEGEYFRGFGQQQRRRRLTEHDQIRLLVGGARDRNANNWCAA